MTCEDPALGALGFQVAATSEAAFVGASAWEDTRLWALDAGGTREIAGLPLKIEASPLALSVAANETLYVLGDETRFGSVNDYPGGLSLVTLSGDFSAKSSVHDPPDVYAGFIDLAVASDGTPYVWHVSDPPEQLSMSALRGDTWREEVIEPSGVDYQRFSLSEAGEPLKFAAKTSDTGYQLTAERAGVVSEFGRVGRSLAVLRYRPIDPAVPIPDSREAVSFAAIVQHPDGLEVAWAMGDAERAAFLAEPVLPEYDCPLGFADVAPCAESCREQRTALEYEAFAATLGRDDIWVAYLLEHGDFDVTYREENIEGTLTCVGDRGTDRSEAELVVVRVPLDGGPFEETLRLNVGEPTRVVSSSAFSDQPPVSIHAFGERVAVAARAGGGEETRVRVLLLTP